MDCMENLDLQKCSAIRYSVHIHTVDVTKMFTKSFTDHVSIIFHQIRKHELVTSVGGLQCFDV